MNAVHDQLLCHLHLQHSVVRFKCSLHVRFDIYALNKRVYNTVNKICCAIAEMKRTIMCRYLIVL